MKQKPIAIAGEICRYFHKDVSKVCHKCHHYVSLRGMNRNTGEEVDEWMCADVAAVILAAEVSQMTREVGGAVESLRNEVVVQQHTTNVMLGSAVQAKLLELKK